MRKFLNRYNIILIPVFIVSVFAAFIFSCTSVKKTSAIEPVLTIPTAELPISNQEKLKYTGSVITLMYHHIRDYTDSSDKLGYSLSVSISSFSNQLDQIKNAGYTAINFNDVVSGKIPEKPIIITFDDGYSNFYQNAYPELAKRNMTAVVFVIADKNGGDYLTYDQIAKLSKNNIEIGSHTLSHPDLRNLTGEQLSNEVITSKSKIENITNQKVISFCYPAGKYNTNIINTVKNAGYHYAVTTHPGLSELTNPFELYRQRMNNGTDILRYLK